MPRYLAWVGGPGGAGGARRGAGVPSIGHFYGKVVDAKTGKGMDGASIQLIQNKYDPVKHAPKDTIISGMITRRKGAISAWRISRSSATSA